ncbi:cyclic nucleotide-binding domain-containing protein [Streptomyces albiflaviniger]|nr:cyclic nucleotide-binding domain-containing protein [Streptomyces albiflaviniger]
MSGEDRSPDTAPEGAAPDETPDLPDQTLDLPDETPDLYSAFPRLTGQQIAFLSGHGTRRSVAAGEAVIREGDRGTDFLVVLSGTIAITEHHGTPDERVLRVHGPGRFLGSRYSPDTRRLRESTPYDSTSTPYGRR